MGSARGYGQLAASPGVTDAESASLGVIDIGQPAGGRAERLATHIVAVCRLLPSSRFALTRCVAGELDDAGRPTIEFRSIIVDATGWLWPMRSGIAPLLNSNTFWNDEAFVRGQYIEWSVAESSGSFRNDDVAAIERLVSSGAGPVLLKSNTRHDAALVQFVASAPEEVARQLQWGIGLARPCSGLDLATLAGGGTGRHAVHMLNDPLGPRGHTGASIATPSFESDDRGVQATRSMWWVVIGVAVVLGLGLWWALSMESTTPTLVTQPGVPPSHVIDAPELVEPSVSAAVPPDRRDVAPPLDVDPPEPAQTEPQLPPAVVPDNNYGQPGRPSAQESAPPESDSTIDVPADPATALGLLQDWHKEVLLILVPRSSRPGGVVNGPVLIRHAENALRPLRLDDEVYGDAMEYLCAFSDAVILLDDIAAIATADAIRHWGAVPATARWFSATGRNERVVLRRINYLKRCAAALRHIAVTVGAIDEVIRHEARKAMDEIEKRGLQHFVGGDPKVVALYESCLGPIRTLLSQDLDTRWPMTAAMPMLAESWEYLRPHRDEQPDGDN
jgi:hypothetical protein